MPGKRWPRIGDLVIVVPDRYYKDEGTYMGIVTSVNRRENVLLAFPGPEPESYNRRYGFHAANVHNNRSMFRIFRNGEEIR